MKKDKIENNPLYKEATYLYKEIRLINEELHILDNAIAQIQVEKVEDEFNYNIETNPLSTFKRFTIKKNRKPNKEQDFFIEESYSMPKIRLSEVELIMLRSFKAERLNDLNLQVQKLSAEIYKSNDNAID